LAYDSTLFSHRTPGLTSYCRVDCRGFWCQACRVLQVLQGPEERHVLVATSSAVSEGKQELQGEAWRGMGLLELVAPFEAGGWVWRPACRSEGRLWLSVGCGWEVSMD